MLDGVPRAARRGARSASYRDLSTESDYHRRVRRYRLFAILALVLATTGTASAQADQASAPPSTRDDELARNHFESGRAYFSRAQYADAAREFQEAYRLSHRLPMLLNLSRALEEADRDDEAIAALDEWLQRSPADDPSRDEVSERRSRLTLELEARRAEAEAAEARAAQARAARTATTAETEHPEGGRRSTLRVLGFAGLGLGGASLVTSLATGLRAHSIHGDLEGRCDASGACPADAASDIDRGRALARTSTATTFIGAGAVAAGLVMMLVGGDDEDAPRVTYTPYVGPGYAGAGLRLSF